MLVSRDDEGMNTSIPIEEVMGSIAEAGSFPPNSSNQADQGIHLCNPVHAGLQLLTDVLARIPGPHQARIQPTRASSRRNAADTTSSAAEAGPAVAVSSSAAAHRTASKQGGHASGAITKEELGRATWTLLHGIAAQYPDHPSRQQKKDVKQLVCSELRHGCCALHEILFRGCTIDANGLIFPENRILLPSYGCLNKSMRPCTTLNNSRRLESIASIILASTGECLRRWIL